MDARPARLWYNRTMKDRVSKKTAEAPFKKCTFSNLAKSVRKRIKQKVLRRRRFLR